MQQDGREPVLQRSPTSIEERGPEFRQGVLGRQGRDDRLLPRREGSAELRMELGERAIPLVRMYHRTLLRENGTVVHDVRAAELVTNARPSGDLNVAGEPRAGALVAGVVCEPDAGDVGLM